MATTIKYTIREERPRPNGAFPIRIRITHNRKIKYLPTPWSVSPSQIDRDGRITDYRIDGYVYDMVRDIRTKIDELGIRAGEMTIDEIADYIETEEEKSKPFALDFVQYTRGFMDKLVKTGREGTMPSYRSAINSLVKFAASESIDISHLTTKFVQNWVDWIAEQPSPRGKYGGRAQSLYFACLRAMHKPRPQGVQRRGTWHYPHTVQSVCEGGCSETEAYAQTSLDGGENSVDSLG